MLGLQSVHVSTWLSAQRRETVSNPHTQKALLVLITYFIIQVLPTTTDHGFQTHASSGLTLLHILHSTMATSLVPDDDVR
jgi:hypothetical protein